MDFKYMLLFATLLACVAADSQRACESSKLSLSCSSGYVLRITSANYGRTSKKYCVNDRMHNLNCKCPDSWNIVKKACENKPSCQIAVNSHVFGDPCPGTSKYLKVTYDCVPANKQACEGDFLDINCPKGKKLKILQANYGRTSNKVCVNQKMNNLNCKSSVSLKVVKAACQDKSSCRIMASNVLFGDPCFGTYKYLHVDYVCN